MKRRTMCSASKLYQAVCWTVGLFMLIWVTLSRYDLNLLPGSGCIEGIYLRLTVVFMKCVINYCVKFRSFNEGLIEIQTMNFIVASMAICTLFLGIIQTEDPPLKIVRK